MDVIEGKITVEKSPATSLPRLTLHRTIFPVIHAVLGCLDRLGWVPSRVTAYLGRPFVYPLDSRIAWTIAHGEEWDPNLCTIIPALLPQDEPIVCEVGSNIGASLLQIKKVKPLAHVLAFEPSDRFRPFLERNLELAGIKDVEISSLLLGRRQGTTWLYNNGSSASVSQARYTGSGPRRKQFTTMTTLDEVFRGRPHVDFIKVDTDGFDLEILRGAEKTLERDSPILYFELFPALLPAPAAADLGWLQSIGYRRFVYFMWDGKPLGVTADMEQVIARATAERYGDILVCREGTSSEARLDDLLRLLGISAASIAC